MKKGRKNKNKSKQGHKRELCYSRGIKIKNKLGFHARAAVKFIKTAEKFKSTIKVTKDNRTVNGKSIMGILTLAAQKGSKITLTAEGEDSKQALRALEELINNKFGEES